MGELDLEASSSYHQREGLLSQATPWRREALRMTLEGRLQLIDEAIYLAVRRRRLCCIRIHNALKTRQ